MESDLVFYQFSRSKVERGDFSHFFSLYAPDKLPAGRRLREMMGTLLFCIDGFDHDPREIHTIPEVRRFYKGFHQAWPYWLYFCSLHEDALKMMVFCCIDSFTAIQVDGQEKGAVECDPEEIAKFLHNDLPNMKQLCEQAKMFEHLAQERIQEIFMYFGLRLP